MVCWCYVALLIYIVIVKQVSHDACSLLICDLMFLTVHGNSKLFEVFCGCLCGAFTQCLPGLFLQRIYKMLIVLVGNDGELVDLMHGIAQTLIVHAVALLIHTDTQSAPHFLSLTNAALCMPECANLKYIRIIPALAQCRMGEDKPRRLVKRQQSFLVFQDKVVGGYIA